METFASALSLAALADSVGGEVQASGWTVDPSTAKPPNTRRWRKTLPDGAAATLDLYPDAGNGGGHRFVLGGWVDLPC
jgi:hypothetical protein